MARKRHSDEDVLKLLREIELKLTGGKDVASACRSVGISDATYYNWRIADIDGYTASAASAPWRALSH